MTDQARGELAPGGLAMVRGLASRTDMNGIEVRLLVLAKAGQVIPIGDVNAELVDSDEGWLCLGARVCDPSMPDSFQGWGFFKAENLLPINPEADPLSIDQRQECEA